MKASETATLALESEKQMSNRCRIRILWLQSRWLHFNGAVQAGVFEEAVQVGVTQERRRHNGRKATYCWKTWNDRVYGKGKIARENIGRK